MIKLSKIPTDAPKNMEKDKTKTERIRLAERIGELQYILHAENKHSVLVILQGMDATGKNGITRKVFSNCSATGLSATAFKKPSSEELSHDFLWRVHDHVPHTGQIVIFNRSHYEDILIQRVHKWINNKRVKKRMDAINSFEDLLQFDNNTTIVKFYLHISKDRQLEKLQERIDEPEKKWKHNAGDWEERKHWDEYMKAYEYAINNSTIPWHIVPSDKRWYRDYFVAKKMVEILEKFKLKLPLLPR